MPYRPSVRAAEDEGRLGAGCYSYDVTWGAVGDAFYVFPVFYPILRPAHVGPKPELAIRITAPNKNAAVPCEHDDVVVTKRDIRHVGIAADFNRDRHVGEVFEERLLAWSAPPAVEIAALGQRGEGVAAGCNLHHGARWQIVEPADLVPGARSPVLISKLG